MRAAPPTGGTGAPLAGGRALPRPEPFARLPVPVRAAERGRAPALRDAPGAAADVRGAAAAPQFAAREGVTELRRFSLVCCSTRSVFFNHCAGAHHEKLSIFT